MNQNAIATTVSVEADAQGKLPERIHLLRTGVFETNKYGRLEITASDIKEMVANFAAGHGRPGPSDNKGGLPVNFAHDKGGKAAAWINRVEAEGRPDGGLDMWGYVDWTGAGKSEIEANNWKYISSEFVPRCLGGFWTSAENATKKVRNVITGAATTNIPMFDGNQGITASAESGGSNDEKQVIYINASAEEQEHKMPTLDEVRVKDAASLTDDDKKVLADALVENSLSAGEKNKFFGIEASAEAPKTVEASAVVGTEGLVTVEASEIKALVDKATKAESEKTTLEQTVEAHGKSLDEFRRKDVEASVDAEIKRGAIVADTRSKWVDRIMVDATVLEDLKAIPSNKVVEAANMGADDQGAGGVSAAAQIEAKVKEVLASDEGKSLDQAGAILKVRQLNPDLAKLYDAEVTQVK